MATVATLLAELALESASFHRDLGKAVTSLESGTARMNKSLAAVERSARTMNKVVGAAITGMATKLSVDAVRAAWDFAGSIEDMAKNVNVGTDALQEFRYAAQQTGGSTESLDAALLKFTQIVGDAANGSKTAVEALKRVGITTDELKSKSMEQLFVEASDALNKMGESANRNSAMVDLFGERSLKTAESLSLSADEMGRLRQEANSVGAVLSEEAIAKAARASDQFNALATVLKVQATSALVEFGPLLVKTTQFLADLGEMATWAGKQIGLLDKTEADAYDDMLARRTELADRLDFLSKAVTPGTIGGGIRDEIKIVSEELKKLDAQILESINKQNAASAAKPAPGTPAATTITAPTINDPAKESERLAQKVEAIRQSYQTETQLLAEKYVAEYELLNQAELQKVEAKASYDEMRLALAAQYEADLTKITEEEAAKRAQAEQRVADTIMSMKIAVIQGAVGLARSLAGESKTAAIAVIAVEKGLAMAQVKMNTSVAAMRALAELGPVAGSAAAAKITALGYTQMGLIAATGLVQAGSVGSGGAAVGSPANPVYTTPSSPYSPDTFGNNTASQSAVQIIIEGNLVGNQQFIDEQLIPALDTAINERDYVFIRGTSRQAAEIQSTI